jgi:hypothetical protein
MRKYLIKASVTTGIEIEVEASNETEAIRKADRISVDKWVSVEDENFEVHSVTEVEDESV